jgi:hypothetical protein
MSETKTPVEPLSAEDIIERLCALQQEVYQHLDHDKAADCFCGKGGFWKSEEYGGTFDQGYRNSGECLGFIESAVREKLTAAPNTAPEGELWHLIPDDRVYAQVLHSLLQSGPWPTSDSRWNTIEYWAKQIIARTNHLARIKEQS